MELSIKKPCHENWDAMTPNEQGAFCHKCVKTVIDFSTKSLEEIRDFFKGKEEEKICGRFEQQQLNALSFDAFFKEFKRFELTKRFAVIVFFTFGFWLFGTSDLHAQTTSTTKGKVAIQEPVRGEVSVAPQPKDTVKNCTKPTHPTPKVVGKIRAVTPRTDTVRLKTGDVIVNPEKKKTQKPGK